MIDDDELDRTLEEAVRADEEAIGRVVSSALSAAPARRFAAGRLAVVGTGAIAVLAAVWLAWPAATDQQGVIRMRNVGEVIVVDYPDGSRAIIGPERTDTALFAGMDYVMFLGDAQ